MNEVDAIVVRLDEPYAWVQAKGPASACGACARKDGCGANPTREGGILDNAIGQARKPQLLRLLNTIQAHPGDAVVVRAADGQVLKSIWHAYGVPLMLGLVLAMLAGAMTESEPMMLAALLIGLGSGFLLLRWRGLESRHAEPILSMHFKRTSIISVKERETC